MLVDLIKFLFLVFKSVFQAHFQCAKHPLSFSLELDSLSTPAPPKTEPWACQARGRKYCSGGTGKLRWLLCRLDQLDGTGNGSMARNRPCSGVPTRARGGRRCHHYSLRSTHCVRVLFDLGHRPTVCAGYWQTPFSVSIIGRIPEFCRPLPVQYRTTRTPSSLINMIVVYSLFFLVFKAL